MNNLRTKKTAGFAAVTLRGGSESIAEAKLALKQAGLVVSDASAHSLVLQDVRAAQLQVVNTAARQQSLSVQLQGPREYQDVERVKVRRAFKLSLQPGKWYFAENLESCPLVFVRDVQIRRVGDTDDEAQVITMELHSTDSSLPEKYAAASNEVAEYGLRPATLDDFEQLGMIVPDAKYLTASTVEASSRDEMYLNNVSIR